MCNTFKNILTLSLLLILNNCSTPGTAFLGPAVTGVKTGSAYQASVSYGSNKFMKQVKKLAHEEIIKIEELSFSASMNYNSYRDQMIEVAKIIPITTYDIEISEVEEPEPLP